MSMRPRAQTDTVSTEPMFSNSGVIDFRMGVSLAPIPASGDVDVTTTPDATQVTRVVVPSDTPKTFTEADMRKAIELAVKTTNDANSEAVARQRSMAVSAAPQPLTERDIRRVVTDSLRDVNTPTHSAYSETSYPTHVNQGNELTRAVVHKAVKSAIESQMRTASPTIRSTHPTLSREVVYNAVKTAIESHTTKSMPASVVKCTNRRQALCGVTY
jgi:hypothetical protein